MRNPYKAALLISSGLTLIASTPVLAQTSAPPATSSQTAPNAPPPVATPPGTPPEAAPAGTSVEATPASPAAEVGSRRPTAVAGDASEAGEVIVTARRVEERLEDVPISITVFNQQQLSNRNIVTPDDLAIYTPSLSTNGVTGRDNTSYSIRGFTQQIDTSPSVAVYFADVVAPRSGGTVPQGDGAGPGSFYDLQNVQVLKGPQGTLFGRNTTGGAVLLVPQKPTGKLEGFVEGLYGSYDWRGLQGAVNVPINDNLRVRLAFDNQSRDGLTKNIGLGPDLDNRNYNAVRGSIVWDVTPSIESYTILSYVHSRDKGSGFTLIGCNPATFVGADVCGPNATEQGGGPHTVSTDLPNPENERDEYRAINTTTWQARDWLTVKNIASYTLLQGHYTSDIFSTDIKVPTAVTVPVLGALPAGALAGTRLQFIDTTDAPNKYATDQKSFTEELQFQGRIGGDRFVWQAGGYYEQSTPNAGYVGNISTQLVNCTNVLALQCYDPIAQVIRQALPAALAGFIPAVGGVQQRLSQIEFRNAGIYGQATYALTDKLKLTGGIRYTSDRVKSLSEETTYTFLVPNVPTANCIEPDANLANNCFLKTSTKSSAPTGLVDLDYKPIQDILLYGKYSRGYRQGSISPDAATGFRTFQPESIDAYETGLKYDIHGPFRGFFNIDYFYNTLYNEQISAVFTAKDTSLATADGILNATKSKTYGFEVESGITPFQGFNVNGSFSYLQTKLISAPPVVLPADSPFASAAYSADIGGPLIYSPHDRGSITPSYILPLDPSIGQVVLAATYSYTSSQTTISKSQSSLGVVPSFYTLNLNLNWNHVHGSNVDLSAFATNVTNKTYEIQVAGILNSSGIEFANFGEQRVVGAKVRYSF